MGQSASIRPVWVPAENAVEQTAMGQFMSTCAARYGFSADYASLHRWSIEDPERFWNEVAQFSGLRLSVPAKQIYRPGGAMRDARWFVGAELNYAENILRADHTGTAIVFCDERGRRRELSRAELAEQVAQVAWSLRKLGLQPRDRVAAVLPNCPEAVVLMLATAAVGAVFSSCSPDFGAPAILDRFEQIRPKIFVGCDGYSYGGKPIDCREKLAHVAELLPQLQHRVLLSFLHESGERSLPEKFTSFDNLLSANKLIDFPQLPFEHPLFIMFSSGTTGKPKCIVHSAGGTLVQHLKEHLLHTDLGKDDRLFYFTTCGWMMWNWLVGALATGATILLYDGSPFFPHALSLWRLVEQERVSVFGTSPRFLRVTELEELLQQESLSLKSLRTVLSTGAPLPAESFAFVSRELGARVQLCSISGGTDIISCFVLGNPLLPVYSGEIQSPGLGMAVEVFDKDGSPVIGAKGDLVCTEAFPSMPLGFWGDEQGSQYQKAYFSHHPGSWTQGDIAERTTHGGFTIYGRSDAVLNPGGVRMGTAEVSDPALTVAGVVDAVAIGQRTAGGERIVLFVVTAEGVSLGVELCARIREAIKTAASPRHVPELILEVADIPRTMSGKTVELAIRAVIHGEDVPNRDSLANPEALQYFSNRPELVL